MDGEWSPVKGGACIVCDRKQVLLPGRAEIICETVSHEKDPISHVSSDRGREGDLTDD